MSESQTYDERTASVIDSRVPTHTHLPIIGKKGPTAMPRIPRVSSVVRKGTWLLPLLPVALVAAALLPYLAQPAVSQQPHMVRAPFVITK